jgi:hypothetical protein
MADYALVAIAHGDDHTELREQLLHPSNWLVIGDLPYLASIAADEVYFELVSAAPVVVAIHLHIRLLFE